MIHAERLTKFYRNHLALNSVQLSIEEGDIVGFLGLNGAGKSTMLSILSGCLLPSHGRVTIDGFDVVREPQKIKPLIGYLPDTPPLYDDMTTRAYLTFVAKLKGLTGIRVEAGLDYAISKTGLGDVQDVRLYELSHGFRQRVGIAQALVHRPRVLILDEPIKGLDPVQIVHMRDLVKSLRGEHTVILSSHILSEVTQTCDQIFILHHGKIIAQGHEVELERNLRVTNRIELEIETPDVNDIESKISRLTGVIKIEKSQVPYATAWTLQIEVDADIRPAIAELVIAEGASLISLARQKSGLEALFVQLVHNQDAKGNGP